MGECPKRGEVSDLCPLGVCLGYGRESIAGGSRLIDHCALAHRQCDATKREWDGPLSPYCWRYQEHGRKAAEAKVKTLVEALKKARMHCGWLLREYQDPEMAAKPGDIVDSTRYVYDLCTAALEQAKGGGAR